LIVRDDANSKDGFAGSDFVAISEHGFLNPRAVEKCAVSALFVDDPAAARTAFERKVKTGHKIVMGHGKLGAVGGSTNEVSLAVRKRDFPADERSRLDFKK
jgi:hypothetical protein